MTVLAAPSLQRMRVVIRGAVQGVGFRPFIYRLACELGLTGWVSNSNEGVFVEVEGEPEQLASFLLRIRPESPPRACIQSLESSLLDPAGFQGFSIRESDSRGPRTALILPDIATCHECAREIFTPGNRRFRYPFTNCTHCGPRFTIIESLPYDRPATTMRGFALCAECRREYEDPADRRFHAQPNACPACGPQLALWSPNGEVLAREDAALLEAARAIREGRIVAVKGIGGFHLLCDARSDAAVRALRRRKHREEKPFALLHPSLDAVERDCHVSPLEARLLASPEAPIVLLDRRDPPGDVTEMVAPGSPTLGVMLPSNPLQLLLMAELGFPVVATSGNLSDEPICTDEREALQRLGSVADLFLVHNRPIARHVDDSIVRLMAGREIVLRRARGFAPLPIFVRRPLAPTLAAGAHLKNTVALAKGDRVFVSQHIGDLETESAFTAHKRVAADLQRLLDIRPGRVACDLHPDYLSTRHARTIRPDARPIQHHVAHVVACMAENELQDPVLGVSWDGTGLGPDGTVWGGEFLACTLSEFRRVAHLRPFLLPGGDRAAREPRRSALGVLHALFGDGALALRGLPPLEAFAASELRVLRGMLARRVNCPSTTSAGRLFDAAASLTGIRQVSRFEGQSAMELEHAAARSQGSGWYDVEVAPPSSHSPPSAEPLLLDWAPMIRALLADRADGARAEEMAARFHAGLARSIVRVAERVGLEQVVLTGGCFQNRLLCEQTIRALRAAGFRPYWHQRIPPNDGGIALGQAVAAGGETAEDLGSSALSSPHSGGKPGLPQGDSNRTTVASRQGAAHPRDYWDGRGGGGALTRRPPARRERGRQG